MNYLDPIGALVITHTGRTLDQHAIDTNPTAAELPAVADMVRGLRHEFVLAEGELHRLLTFAADADVYRDPETVLEPLIDTFLACAAKYGAARKILAAYLADLPPSQGTSHVLPAARRRVRLGETVHIRLPHTPVCRDLGIAGRIVHVRVGETFAITGPVTGMWHLRLGHHDAGIYRDPISGTLYTLDRTRR